MRNYMQLNKKLLASVVAEAQQTTPSPRFVHSGIVSSHIHNLFSGVRSEMKTAYMPININTSCRRQKRVEVRNFLLEKHLRVVRMLDGVSCEHTGIKDEIQMEGNDLEKVSLSAALIHHAVSPCQTEGHTRILEWE